MGCYSECGITHRPEQQMLCYQILFLEIPQLSGDHSEMCGDFTIIATPSKGNKTYGHPPVP